MNRIEDYYKIAIKFMSLPSADRYVIGTHFGAVKYKDFIDNEEQMMYTIFSRVLNTNRYIEFSQIVRNYKNAT